MITSGLQPQRQTFVYFLNNLWKVVGCFYNKMSSSLIQDIGGSSNFIIEIFFVGLRHLLFSHTYIVSRLADPDGPTTGIQSRLDPTSRVIHLDHGLGRPHVQLDHVEVYHAWSWSATWHHVTGHIAIRL